MALSDSAVHAIAGAGGGMVAMTLTYPLVNLSTRSQVAAKNSAKTTREALLQVLKDDGIVGLYDGLSSSLLGIAVTNGIYYGFFEKTRDVLLKRKAGVNASLSTLESMLASAIAGAATSVISNPIWVVNTRQTVRTTVREQQKQGLPTTSKDVNKKAVVEKKLNVIQTILHILRTDGIGAFFHGLGPALILVSNPILQFTLFEQLRNWIVARRSANLSASKGGAAVAALSDLDFFLLGAVSKLFATATTYPYLTVKARMQAGGKDRYTSSFDGVQRILAEDGPSGLYRGIGPKLTQSVATAAILFLAKEKIYQATVKALSTVAKVPAK